MSATVTSEQFMSDQVQSERAMPTQDKKSMRKRVQVETDIDLLLMKSLVVEDIDQSTRRMVTNQDNVSARNHYDTLRLKSKE